MTESLEGRVALVTGAGRGIGREIAIGLAGAGAHVALVSRTPAELEEVGNTIEHRGGQAAVITADVGNPASAAAATEAAVAQLGSIDILINNAAIVAPLGPTQSLDPAAILTALAVNVAGVVVLGGLVIPAMLTARWGRIVNISSGIAAHPEAMVGGNVYAASKAALEASTINLAAELRGTGITVNAYRPGAVDTAMQAWIRAQSPDEIGHDLHGRFTTIHQAGELISAEHSAARLLSRIPCLETGQLWNVSDQLPDAPLGDPDNGPDR
jgi:NAD(P)-dependent dehydrogenase (short-subunit alcohol dehydrogenase family)